MKSKIAILLLFLLCCYAAKGQNLVPNPSFEEYHNCPVFSNNIPYSPTYDSFLTVKAWVSPTWASPDYFNSCGAGSYLIPDNSEGSQMPHKGNAYVGLICYNGGGYAEYIECKLRKAMLRGHLYITSFYVSLGDLSMIAIDQIAAHFSDTAYYQPYAPPLSLSKDISSPPGIFITDTSGWVLVKDTFQAQGGEEWMTIGKFADTLYRSRPVSSSGHAYSYLYIDDVSITDLRPDTITKDTIICALNTPLKLRATSTQGVHSWSNGDTASYINVALPGNYICITRDTQVYVDEFEIRKVPHLFVGNDTIICKQAAGTVAFGSTKAKGSSYTWNTGDTLSDIYPLYAGVYTLTERNECGTSTDSVNVNISDCELNVALPSAFTPNGDGVNDVLYVRGNAISSIHLLIYDRKGRQVFESENIQIGWNGMYNGAYLPPDTYVYVLSVSFTYGLSVTKKGSIVLIR